MDEHGGPAARNRKPGEDRGKSVQIDAVDCQAVNGPGQNGEHRAQSPDEKQCDRRVSDGKGEMNERRDQQDVPSSRRH